MQKILMISDGLVFPRGAFEFIKALHQQHKELWIKAIFLNLLDYKSLLTYDEAFEHSVQAQACSMERGMDVKVMENLIVQFEEECRQYSIPYVLRNKLVYRNLAGLIHETRYSDLIVMSGDFFFNGPAETQPNEMMRQLLHKTECPALIIPDNFTGIGEVCFAYDGSDSSMYAIRQFNRLFLPSFFTSSKVVYLAKEKEQIPDLQLLKEYFSHQYPEIRIEKLPADKLSGLSAWLHPPGTHLVVAGSFSRSIFSTLWKESFISSIIGEHRSPVFIAH